MKVKYMHLGVRVGVIFANHYYCKASNSMLHQGELGHAIYLYALVLRPVPFLLKKT